MENIPGLYLAPGHDDNDVTFSNSEGTTPIRSMNR